MTTEAPAKPHTSATAIEDYLMCGEYYLQTRIEGKRGPKSLPALRGISLHAAAANNYTQKIETAADLPQSDFIDFAVAQFDGGLSTGVHLSKEDESIGAAKVIGKTRDSVADLSRFHIREQAPEYNPELVEQRFRLELPGSHDLVGVVDLYDKKKIVTDFKSRARYGSQNEVDSSPQLTIYFAGVHALTGSPPEAVQLDITINNSAGVKRQVLRSTRDDADLTALAWRIDTVTAAINAGIFPPAAAGHWKCSATYCPLWYGCKYVNSERIAKSQG